MKNLTSNSKKYSLSEFLPAIVSGLICVAFVSMKKSLNPYLGMLITLLSLIFVVIFLIRILVKHYEPNNLFFGSVISIATFGFIILSVILLILVAKNIFVLIPDWNAVAF